MANTPIKFIVKEKSLIGNELFEAGAEVTLPEGTLPADNLEPMCERGVALQEEYKRSNAERVAKMREQYAEEGGQNMEALGKLIAAAVATALANQKTEDEALRARIAELEAAAAAAKKPAKAKAEPAGDAALA